MSRLCLFTGCCWWFWLKVELIVCRALTTQTGSDVHDFVLNHVIWPLGEMGVLQTDNGKNILCKELKELCKKKGIEMIQCSPRHPETNGKVYLWMMF